MIDIESAVIEGDQYPRMVIYLIYPHQLHGLMTGRARITNLPEGARLYKIVQYRPDDCDNTIAVWFTHPEFEEVPWGNLVRIEYLLWEEIEK